MKKNILLTGLIISLLAIPFFSTQAETLDENNLGETEETTPEEMVAEIINEPEENEELTALMITEIPEQTEEFTPITVNFNLRFQDQFIFAGDITLPTSTDILDSTGVNHFTTSTNVLTALISADNLSDDFKISLLDYYSDYGSFYLNCLEIATTSACGNWNYIVNDNYPNLAMDSYSLNGGENIFIYFSDPWKITATTSTFEVDTTTTLQTWKFDYVNNLNEWLPDGNHLIDISVNNPNPTGWWDTTLTVSTIYTNTDGYTDFIFSTTGTFYAKITSDDYSKWSNPITLNVLDKITLTTSTASSTENPGGDSGSTSEGTSENNVLISNTQIETSVNKILEFLQSKQTADGKIIDGGISDWSAMSLTANSIQPNEKLIKAIYNYNFEDASDLNYCASYPRHLLALKSLGYGNDNARVQELKKYILDNCYVNTNFGQAGINDDVFGLLSLLNLDLAPTDQIIQDIIADILADQQADGSFTWNGYAGADITGAVINALKYAESKGVVVEQNVYAQAKAYLKNTQLDDGGWGYDNSDVLTTAWVMMGINALGENQNNWFKNETNPWYVLVNNLSDDGSYKISSSQNTDWFATKHAVPALLEKTWPITNITNISDNTNSNGVGGNAEEVIIISTTTPTTTLDIIISTSTPTTTLDILVATTTVATSIEEKIVEQIQSKNKKNLDPAISQDDRLKQNDDKITSSFLPRNDNATPVEILLSGEKETTKENLEKLINELPLDSPTRRNFKKMLALSGGGATLIGFYLGFKLLKNIV